jgi:flagellar basal-body rod protein FlgB
MIGALNEAMQFHSTALRLRSERQQVLASNIANADTPGYKAQDFDFAGSLSAALSGAAPQSPALAATAAGHIAPARSSLPPPTLQYRTPSQSSVDGNSVEMDTERANFADNAVRYEASLRLLNGQIKSILSAITG